MKDLEKYLLNYRIKSVERRKAILLEEGLSLKHIMNVIDFECRKGLHDTKPYVIDHVNQSVTLLWNDEVISIEEAVIRGIL